MVVGADGPREPRPARNRPGPARVSSTPPLRLTTLTPAASAPAASAPERIRTSDTRFRKPLLYPLSYGGRRCCLHGRSRFGGDTIRLRTLRRSAQRIRQAWPRIPQKSPTSSRDSSSRLIAKAGRAAVLVRMQQDGHDDEVAEEATVLLRHLIGAALRRARQRQGRTLREVADAAQVSKPYLSEVERGRKEASSEVLAAICRALGLRLSDLLDEVRQDLTRLEPQRATAVPTRVRGGAAQTSLCTAQRRMPRSNAELRCVRPSRTSRVGAATAAHHRGCRNDVVDEAVLQRLLSGEPAVSIRVCGDALDALTGV
jgi:transcriptional regulator with XRE-family HTH domain